MGWGAYKCRAFFARLSRQQESTWSRLVPSSRMVRETEEALLVKVLDYSYTLDLPEKVQEHVRMAKEKLETDPVMVGTCFLTPEDTVNIFDRGHTIRVLRPQAYDGVSALDASELLTRCEAALVRCQRPCSDQPATRRRGHCTAWTNGGAGSARGTPGRLVIGARVHAGGGGEEDEHLTRRARERNFIRAWCHVLM